MDEMTTEGQDPAVDDVFIGKNCLEMCQMSANDMAMSASPTIQYRSALPLGLGPIKIAAENREINGFK